MGLLFSYFRRPKDSVAELEAIETQLNRLEAWRQNQLRLQKRLLGYLLIAFLISYLTALGVYYVYCLPVASRLTQLLHFAAFLTVLPLFYALRRCLLWIFVRSLAGCESRASRLREDKRKVLDRVMDTETYKRAKEILDRFDPDRFKVEFQQPQQQQSGQAVKPGQFFAKSPLAKRPPSQQQPPQGVVLRQLSAVPHPQQPHPTQSPRQPPQSQQPPQQPPPQPLRPPPQLPRPILSRDRSTMDRLIDMLVGDGADRRYALICRRCCGHNGMAMAEEFPHLAWRCAYCAFLHSPRQPLPHPPMLAMSPEQQQQQQLLAQRSRPQWQSLTDLRPSATAATTAPLGASSPDGVGGELSSGGSSASSSVASTPALTRKMNGFDEKLVEQAKPEAATAKGAADADAADPEDDTDGVESVEQAVRRRACLATEPSE